jgi:hypothetical protein
MASMNGGDATRGGGGNTKDRRSGSISEMESPKNPNTAGPKRRGSNNNSSNGNSNINTKNATPTSAGSAVSNSSKVSAQMQKMRDANNKYKNLLKMAKERIERQEIELKEMRGECCKQLLFVDLI